MRLFQGFNKDLLSNMVPTKQMNSNQGET